MEVDPDGGEVASDGEQPTVSSQHLPCILCPMTSPYDQRRRNRPAHP